MHVPSRVIRPQKVASAPLPTRHGVFTTHVFRDEEDVEHVALVHGTIAGQAGSLVRVHSECMTSEVFGSLKCDCKGQLDAAFAEIGRRGSGAILYLRQEGRGIGLANKIRAYDLQSHGHDTVDANRLLGLPDDARRYDVAAHMLEHFGVKSVRLMTNNPEKVRALRALGVKIVARVPVLVAANPFSARYLETKRARMAHAIPGLTSRAGALGLTPQAGTPGLTPQAKAAVLTSHAGALGLTPQAGTPGESNPDLEAASGDAE
jgi:GTP cyclohydrolase II